MFVSKTRTEWPFDHTRLAHARADCAAVLAGTSIGSM